MCVFLQTGRHANYVRCSSLSNEHFILSSCQHETRSSFALTSLMHCVCVHLCAYELWAGRHFDMLLFVRVRLCKCFRTRHKYTRVYIIVGIYCGSETTAVPAADFFAAELLRGSAVSSVFTLINVLCVCVSTTNINSI